MVPAFGWSVGDLIKLIDISVTVYEAFKNVHNNSSHRFQLLSDEFARFQTCLELLRDLLKEHNKNLYFGYDQFKATLEECHEFLQKYAVLGESRISIAKIIKTIGWTTEEKTTIDRLLAAVHGHAHVIGLYIGYMTLKTSLEHSAVTERLHQETRNEVGLLRGYPSNPSMPFITEEQEGPVANNLNPNSSAESTGASKLEQVAKELDGFSHVLKYEKYSRWSRIGDSRLQNNADTANSDKLEEHGAGSIELDLTSLLEVLRDVEQKLELAQNSLKREYNKQVVRQKFWHGTHGPGISDIFISPGSKGNTLLSTSPTIPSGSGVPVRRLSSEASLNIPTPRLESWRCVLPHQPSTSPTSPLFLGSSPPTSRWGTEMNTAETTPISAVTAQHQIPKPPNFSLRFATKDWYSFCTDVVVIWKGWPDHRLCNISQRRRMRDGGLSLKAELADGSCLYHDLPALGTVVPHTSHTGVYSGARNAVTFKEPYGHQLRKVARQEESYDSDKSPKYIFRNAADHKAFQELIYGCELQWSWNITMIRSDREKESTGQTLRLWRDAHGRTPVILFYTNMRQRSSKIYIQEPKSSFRDEMKVEKKCPIAQLDFLEQKHDKKTQRAGSMGSVDSNLGSVRSGRTATVKAPPLQWIEIEFADLAERDHFLSLW